MLKKSRLIGAGLVLVSILCASDSGADTIGFNGYYDYSTWSSYSNIPGPATTVHSIDGTQQTLTLWEPDGATYGGPFMQGSQFFSHTIGAAGTLSFDWNFDWTIDACCSGFNVYINSTEYNLANGYPASPYHHSGGNTSGTFSAIVAPGDVFTFAAFTADNCCQPAHTVINNFEAPASAVPDAGSTVTLYSLGLLGLSALRRKFHR